MTLTATAERVREADVTEVVMLAYWRTVLRLPLGTYHRGETHEDRAERVVHLMHSATDYEPLLGVPMEVCEGRDCETWVAETARDEHGHLWCSDGCRDDASHAAEERRYSEARYRMAEPGGWH